ncbi:rhodanese-like domain-containing protein [Aestuariirhabdus sp. Z084]|uniref:rhodanese-like domain-containing protein n=1 Tax=Aestuariirhabdus haliotis TaxID=2918751 RepID=UPI00201B3786|nr:rhodanese-like domain-containing protein [Aestuariirhabdus haliotis]MCL6416781.1 rhodanese-like domain-containing protein [Aestuariirhabdus haliotis]MCL6420754.1 rhodanese-like domain-containing protein [Aestuariirhabdus haliotis]
MKRLFTVMLISVLASLSSVANSASGEEKPVWWFFDTVDVEFVSQYATVPPKKDVMIIDSRPSRKYKKGHIVPAINISDSQFAKMTGALPQDKSSLLIFYCGGMKCSLSHKSAAKAVALGYSNVKVYAAGYPDWLKNSHTPGVSAAYVKALIDKGAPSVIIDARPARKFASGHVPTAINIPQRQFDGNVAKLPVDKSTELIYYCGGYKCTLSTKSADKAIALGYTKVRLFQGGYPEWKQAYGDSGMQGSGGESTVSIESGEDDGTISIASFTELTMNKPDSIYWYDVRDPEELEADGHFAKAANLTVDDVESAVDELPSDKPIVFFCATGARSGEAYDIVKMGRDNLDVYFLDANVEFFADGRAPKATPVD